MSSLYKFTTAIVIMLVSIAAFNVWSDVNKPNPKDDPSVYCKPYAKEIGEIVTYQGIDGKIQRVSRFEEYKTAAGFKMRLPRGTGSMGNPNKQCQMETAQFNFRWFNGKLFPTWDYKTGRRMEDGSAVHYFVRFSLPSENPVRKFDYPKWMFEGVFPIPGHEKIRVLPFAEWMRPEFIPANRNDRSQWRPRLLLDEAHDLAGNPITFFCDAGLSYEEQGGTLFVSVNHSRKYSDKCMGGLAFVSGAGGRLDIYDEDFLGQGAAITNAVIKELNSYITKG
jgi:hypothetical protein